ncbi:MAG TPA: response regulator [Chroococcales cyanobacterium]|jgi:CheY-like chemotaxis protein
MNELSSESDTSVTRILVVDDIADNYILLQTILELEGYLVEVTDSSYAALEMIEVNRPDLILLDVMMPEINGFEMTRRIRRNNRLPFIPILLVTAYREIEESKAFYTGANGLLYQPINPDLLLKQVRTILNNFNNYQAIITFC